MGHGSYSYDAHAALAASRNASPNVEVFTQTRCHPLMDPRGIKMRESRDSADHPNSLAVAFALDVTGSMGDIPEMLARQELPNFMKLLQQCHIADPQLLFMAIGDATSDRAALQVGQFESTAELMDQWLTWSYLEGGGGGSGEESYELAFYMAAQHTDLDCWNKRKKKGYLFLTGDELPYPAVSRHQIDTLLGEKLDEDLPIEEVIAAAAESWHLFFLIPDLQRRARCEARWRELLGEHVICMDAPQDACIVAAAIVGLTEGGLPSLEALATVLKDGGIERRRIAGVLRALASYADVLDPDAANRVHLSDGGAGAGGEGEGGDHAAKPAWWQRLFA